MKKYFIRSVKYFIFLVAIMMLIMVAFVAAGFVESGVENMFRNGYNALWQIALLFAAIAAIYPKVGFTTRKALLRGSWDEMKGQIMIYMAERQYVLEKDFGNNMSFRRRNWLSRLLKFTEDRIVIARTYEEDSEENQIGIENQMKASLPKCTVSITGQSKDVLRILSGLLGIHLQNNGQ